MARKNDNKRVLRSGNGRNKASNRKVRRRRKNNFNARPAMPVSQNPRRAKKKRVGLLLKKDYQLQPVGSPRNGTKSRAVQYLQY